MRSGLLGLLCNLYPCEMDRKFITDSVLSIFQCKMNVYVNEGASCGLGDDFTIICPHRKNP